MLRSIHALGAGGTVWALPARDGLWGSSRVCTLQFQGCCTSRAAQLPTPQRSAAITMALKSLTTRLNAFTHSPFTLYLLLMAAQLISRPQCVWYCRCTEGQQVLALRSLQPNYKWQQMEGKHCEPFCFSLGNLTQVTTYNQTETIAPSAMCHSPGCSISQPVSHTEWQWPLPGQNTGPQETGGFTDHHLYGDFAGSQQESARLNPHLFTKGPHV